MKKIFSFIAILFATLLLTACNFVSQVPPEITEDDINITPDQNATGKLTISMGTSTEEQAIITGVAEIFNRTYPNIEVVLNPIAGEVAPTIAQLFNADRVKPGSMPDIFWTTSFDMLQLSDKRVILNLDPYINKETTAGTFDVNDYYEEFWKLGQQNFDGNQLMVPRAADKVVTHINKKLLAEAGVDLSLVKNGWTWDDFQTVMTQARTFYDNNGKQNQYLINSNATWEAIYNPIMQAFGADVFDENKEISVNTPEMENALKLIKSMKDNRWIAPLTQEPASFQGGKALMMFHSQATKVIIRDLKTVYPNDDISEIYDVVSFPLIGDNPQIGGGVSGYAVYANSTNRDYAWQFLKILLSKEGQNAVSDASGVNTPPIRKDMSDPKDPNNHWGLNMEAYNLEAYTFGPEYTSATTFTTVNKPEYAKDIMDTVKLMVINYVDVGRTFAEAASYCENQINAYLQL